MIKSIAKKTITRFVPPAVLEMIKGRYYVYVMKRFSESAEPDLAIVKKLVSPGDTVVDVGANVGVYTLFLSRYVSEAGKVFSIEPMPSTFRSLKAVVEKIALGNVSLINCAVANESGQSVMTVPQYSDGGDNFYQARLSAVGETASSEDIQVQVEKLDNLIPEGIEDIAFIKIDVEGAELDCLCGAAAVFERFKPAALVEIGSDVNDAESDGGRIVKMFSDWGYSVFHNVDSELVEVQAGEGFVNYFFLRPEHLASFV